MSDLPVNSLPAVKPESTESPPIPMSTETMTPPLPVSGNGDHLTEEELLLKWDDHHRSFFELAEDLCHQEQFVDVTLSCGDHNFPAHKLILSVCSPYFRHLFLRNPCKHPIVVLKDVHFKYMKLLLMYMYRGEVSCPQEDLPGLLRTARSLQIRGLVELERKREAEGLTNSITGSPIKRSSSDIPDGASTTSGDLDSRAGDFSLDEVRSRLHGQLEIQPISQPISSSLQHLSERAGGWLDRQLSKATSSTHEGQHDGTGSEGQHSEEEHYQRVLKRETTRTPMGSPYDGGGNNGDLQPRDLSRRSSTMTSTSTKRSRPSSTTSSSTTALLAAAQLAGMPLSALDPSDPMSSMNTLIAAAQAQSSSASLATTLAASLPASTPATTTSTASGAGQGVDLSQAATMANLYYYMQRVASAGMGNPKERKECPICGKTLYDRSTWNRHMRIHTGEKPYPCRYCGRRFRTNYNKLGHEKKCPDGHARAMMQANNGQTATAAGDNAIYR